MKIKKGDNVIVKTGKSKGETGTVLRVFPATNRVIVAGANKITRRVKSKKRGEKGSVVEKEASLHISNVMLVEGKKGVRAGVEYKGEKKVRVSKKTGKEL